MWVGVVLVMATSPATRTSVARMSVFAVKDIGAIPWTNPIVMVAPGDGNPPHCGASGTKSEALRTDSAVGPKQSVPVWRVMRQHGTDLGIRIRTNIFTAIIIHVESPVH